MWSQDLYDELILVPEIVLERIFLRNTPSYCYLLPSIFCGVSMWEALNVESFPRLWCLHFLRTVMLSYISFSDVNMKQRFTTANDRWHFFGCLWNRHRQQRYLYFIVSLVLVIYFYCLFEGCKENRYGKKEKHLREYLHKTFFDDILWRNEISKFHFIFIKPVNNEFILCCFFFVTIFCLFFFLWWWGDFISSKDSNTRYTGRM